MARIHYSDEGRTMGADKTTSWSYAEAFAAEDELAYRARERSLALRIPPVTPGTAAALTVLAAAARPATVVEVGTGAGVSGLALLRGLPGTSVLTTIDTDIRALRAARDTFREAGIPTSRTRTIPGRASLVMPRLSAGAYDLVFLDADPEGTLDYAEEAVRLLRPGGMLVVNDALSQDKVAQPANREENTRTMRAVHRLFREDERFSTALLTTGSGLLLAVRRPRRWSLGDAGQALLELRGLGRLQLDHQPSAALERHPHDQAPPLLGDLHRSVTGSRLHGRHVGTPLPRLVWLPSYPSRNRGPGPPRRPGVRVGVPGAGCGRDQGG